MFQMIDLYINSENIGILIWLEKLIKDIWILLNNNFY